VRFVDFRKLCATAAPEDLECLRRLPLAFFDNQTGCRSEQVKVVSDSEGVAHTPIVDLRQIDRFEPEGDMDAVAAYLRICKAAEDAHESLQLDRGDLVIFHNKRCMHSWIPCEASGDTWLQSAYASCDAMSWPDRVLQ